MKIESTRSWTGSKGSSYRAVGELMAATITKSTNQGNFLIRARGGIPRQLHVPIGEGRSSLTIVTGFRMLSTRGL